MTLQHRRTRAVQFLLQRFNDVRMIVPGVVYAISRKKVEIRGAVFGVELATLASLVANVHAQKLKQSNPLRVDAFCIQVLSSERGQAQAIILRIGGAQLNPANGSIRE